MTSNESYVDWASVGRPLEELLRHEREYGHDERAAYDLVAALANEPEFSPWRRFLVEGENFATAVRQVVAGSKPGGISPRSALESTRKLVETGYARDNGHDLAVMSDYLRFRPDLPGDVRDALDQLVKAGKSTVPRRAFALASELKRMNDRGSIDRVPREIFDYWYREVLEGKVTSRQARKIPAQVLAARDSLLDHLRGSQKSGAVDGVALFEKYAPIFTAADIPAAVEIVIGMERDRLRLGVELIEPFLTKLPKEEVVRRFRRLKEWAGSRRDYDFDPTPVVVEFLSTPGDFESLLAELDRLIRETRSGRFRVDNALQKDLEYEKFRREHDRLYGTNRTLPYGNVSSAEMYRRFGELEELDYDQEDEAWALGGQHLVEVKRAAYEAAGFLRFLLEFRSATNRRIVVVGNNRYGRQWIVEPIEDFLGDGFTIRYDGVPSHTSMRLTVPWARNFEQGADNTGPWTPDAFPMEFVREILEEMPHFVIVDGKSLTGVGGLMTFSRATKSYAHWFAAFNDLRAQGDAARYQHESCLSADHLAELMEWYEFVRLRRQLSDWVTPGETYGMSMWAPEVTELAQLGELQVPCRVPDLASERPQVVLANPIIYRTDGDDSPEALRGTRPYYFDGPEKYFQEDIVFGFGPYGFQPAIKGTLTSTFVSAVQRHIKAEVASLMDGPGAD